MSQLSVDDLVSQYVQIRDVKQKLKKQFEEKLKPLEEAAQQIEGVLLKMFSDMGVDSAKTASGTAYKSTRARAAVADWEHCLDWIIRHGHWSMLEKRVSKDAVQAYREEFGDLPPGINWAEEVVVNVRRG